MRKRGYSREFPAAPTSKNYLLDTIPIELWTAVRAHARRDGVSVRALILRMLRAYVEHREAPAAAATEAQS